MQAPACEAMIYLHKWLEARSKHTPPYVDRQMEISILKIVTSPTVQKFDLGTSSEATWVRNLEDLPSEARHLPYRTILLQMEIECPHDPQIATGSRRDLIICDEREDGIFIAVLSLVSISLVGTARHTEMAVVYGFGLVDMKTGGIQWRDGDGVPEGKASLLQGGAILLAFLSAVNCTNVVRAQHAAPDKLNSKRAKAGRPPICSFWTLHIKDQANLAIGFKRGSHDSPRLHLRRGHPRQYAPGKYCWVQPHIVGSKENGVVRKDYAITLPAPAPR